jgi:hypothetical protein
VGVEVIELTVKNRAAWRRWLKKNHRTSHGVWLTLAKNAKPGPTTLNYNEALDESLCFGWIDGQRGAGDGTTARQRFTGLSHSSGRPSGWDHPGWLSDQSSSSRRRNNDDPNHHRDCGQDNSPCRVAVQERSTARELLVESGRSCSDFLLATSDPSTQIKQVCVRPECPQQSKQRAVASAIDDDVANRSRRPELLQRSHR